MHYMSIEGKNHMTNNDQLVFRLPRDLARQARKSAKSRRISIGEWMREAVKEKQARGEGER